MPLLARAYSANLETFPTLPRPSRNQVIYGQIRHRAGRVGRVGKVYSFASMCAPHVRANPPYPPMLPLPAPPSASRLSPPKREPGLMRATRPVGPGPARTARPGVAARPCPRRRAWSPRSGRRHSKVLYHRGIDRAARPVLEGRPGHLARAASDRPGAAWPVSGAGKASTRSAGPCRPHRRSSGSWRRARSRRLRPRGVPGGRVVRLTAAPGAPGCR